jgi:hypothetical protein
MEKLGQEPAFGYPAHSDIDDPPGWSRSCNTHEERKGMSKRFYAACAILQGLATAIEFRQDKSVEEDVKLAYEYADELLKQENGDKI